MSRVLGSGGQAESLPRSRRARWLPRAVALGHGVQCALVECIKRISRRSGAESVSRQLWIYRTPWSMESCVNILPSNCQLAIMRAYWIVRKWLRGRASPCQGEGHGFESRLPLPATHKNAEVGDKERCFCRASFFARAKTDTRVEHQVIALTAVLR